VDLRARARGGGAVPRRIWGYWEGPRTDVVEACFASWRAHHPDWDVVVTPAVDWVVARPDVDPDRIALMGMSLGGLLGPRALGIRALRA